MLGLRKRGRTGAPDFVGIGAQGGGAGWWHSLLRGHPDIVSPTGKRSGSLRFFAEFCEREMRDADVAGYHARFPHAAGTISGEWTTRYMYDPWIPPLLARAAPQTRLLAILCDPIDRFALRLASLRDHAGADEERLELTDSARRGRYASQLRRFLECFDRDQLLVLQLEACGRDPLGEYQRTLRFLGVDESFVPRRLARRLPERAPNGLDAPEGMRARMRGRRAAKLQPARLWPDVEATLHDELDDDVRDLRALVPELDLGLWPNFAHLR